jgi:hypothetical protein
MKKKTVMKNNRRKRTIQRMVFLNTRPEKPESQIDKINNRYGDEIGASALIDLARFVMMIIIAGVLSQVNSTGLICQLFQVGCPPENLPVVITVDFIPPTLHPTQPSPTIEPATPTEASTPSPEPSPSPTTQPGFCDRGQPIPRNSEYTAVEGDNLSCLAARSGVSLKMLLVANPQIDDPDLIIIGTVIHIP